MYQLEIDYGNGVIAKGNYDSMEAAKEVARNDAKEFDSWIWWKESFDGNGFEISFADGSEVKYKVTVIS